jgi:hypothetical protein
MRTSAAAHRAQFPHLQAQPAKVGVTTHRVENGLALLIALRVPGAAINQAQRETLTCSYFTKSIANKPL